MTIQPSEAGKQDGEHNESERAIGEFVMGLGLREMLILQKRGLSPSSILTVVGWDGEHTIWQHFG